MDRRDLARVLILEYIEQGAATDSELSEQYGLALTTLKAIWGIASTPDHPGCPSLETLFATFPEPVERDNLERNGKAALGRGDFDAAIANYDPLIASDERSSAFLKGRTGALLKQGNFEAAATDCARAVALDPQNPVCHLRLVYALMALGRAGEVASAYERALVCCPCDPALRDFAVVLGVG
jgi:tetratricopeptide (TPR) repeat protein